MRDFEIEIREDGTILFNRQNIELIEDIREILYQLSTDIQEIDAFLSGREFIDLLRGKEIFCG